MTKQVKTRQRGQTMMEYIIIFVLFLGVVTIFTYFVYGVRKQTNRSLDLIGSNYP